VADNTQRPATSGGDTITSDELVVDGVVTSKAQTMKILLGQDGVDDGPVRRALALSLAGADAEKWDAIVEKFGLVADQFADRALKNKRRKGGSMLSYVRAPIAFEVTDQALEGLWRGTYTGSPWNGTASVGGSGSRSLSEATNPPTQGTPLSYVPADYNGTNQLMKSSVNMSTFLSESAASGWVLFNADTAVADAGAGSRINNPYLIGQDTGGTTFGMGYSDAGVTLAVFNTLAAYTEIVIAASTGAWHLAQFKWDGTNISLRVDGGAWSSVAATPASFSANVMVQATNFAASAWYDGRIMETALTPRVFGDSIFDEVRGYCARRYGVAV
jgi:hypothetical protein